MSTHPISTDLNALNKGQRQALVIYLLGQATYENLFKKYSIGGISNDPNAQFTGHLRDTLLECYYNVFDNSPHTEVDHYVNTVELLEYLRHTMKDYDTLLEELRGAYGKKQILHYVTMIRQAVDQLGLNSFD
ncbi:hypothetical protein FNH22_16165 [Fulvivirga sp. M361]|uniref:hypothetical protein n=1 Tax=Fulvivirga sp. M361 TaxID=2594266 RepID=UPI00117BD51A|nr:hypothetical protein [Fulvivirga sp. M361]TRX56175.1 hypothetical protein FNH22_16165 [Fulvivirga sp. M361]